MMKNRKITILLYIEDEQYIFLHRRLRELLDIYTPSFSTVSEHIGIQDQDIP